MLRVFADRRGTTVRACSDVSDAMIQPDLSHVDIDNATWNLALLDRLFPAGDTPGAPRLLAADEDLIVSIGAALGRLSADVAIPAFVRAVDDRWGISRSHSF